MPIKKRLFPSGIKLESVDLQALSDNFEQGIAEVVAAFASAGSSGENVLFADTSASITTSGLQVNVPAQYFAVNGRIGEYVGGSILLGANGTYHLYFKLTLVNSAESREKLVGAAAKSESVNVSCTYNVSLNLTVAPAVPVLNNDELRFATVVTGATTVTTVTFDPDNYLIAFTGSVSSNHAASHKPGGADPIGLASSTNNVTGLMPPAYVKVIEAAVTNVSTTGALSLTLDSARSFSTAPSQNAALTNRSATLSVSTDPLSFIQSTTIQPRFNNSPIPGVVENPGISPLFARADHVHAGGPGGGNKFNAQLLVYVDGVRGSSSAIALGGSIAIVDLKQNQSSSTFVQNFDPARLPNDFMVLYKEAPITNECEIESVATFFIPPIKTTEFTLQAESATAGRELSRERCRRFRADTANNAFIPISMAAAGLTPAWFDYVSGVKISFNDNQLFSFSVAPAVTVLGNLEYAAVQTDYTANANKYIQKPYYMESGATAVNSETGVANYLPSGQFAPTNLLPITTGTYNFARPINGWLLFKFVINKTRPTL
jgi:hypothetical protein